MCNTIFTNAAFEIRLFRDCILTTNNSICFNTFNIFIYKYLQILTHLLLFLPPHYQIIPGIANALQEVLDNSEREQGSAAKEGNQKMLSDDDDDDDDEYDDDDENDYKVPKEKHKPKPKTPSRHMLISAISSSLSNPDLGDSLKAIEEIFTESTTFSRNPHAMRHQECFALRPNAHGMIDLLRKTFLANVDDIYTLADEYAETYGIFVTVKENSSRG